MPTGSVTARAARAKSILINSNIADWAFFPIIYLPRFFSKQSEMIIDF
jgi:hypothetical protein